MMMINIIIIDDTSSLLRL